MKPILFIINKLPYSNLDQEENIEMILFAASFGCKIAVIFRGEGVWQLLASQTPLNSQKSVAKMIASFPAFEIERIYACEEDVAQFSLKPKQFSVNLQLISMNEIMELIRQHDVVIEM